MNKKYEANETTVKAAEMNPTSEILFRKLSICTAQIVLIIADARATIKPVTASFPIPVNMCPPFCFLTNTPMNNLISLTI